MKKSTQERDLIVETLINKMFEIAGHNVTYKDIIDRKDEWYREWTMTEQQEKEWVDWGVKHIHKSYKHFSIDIAKREMAMFNLAYGLKIKKDEQQSTN